ncbi:MAG: histidine phosphatase family protein, partial [Alicyclobacillus sp.]|nr:histidine phosphatase family protein [Alicyclobacillus sp.]
MKNIYLIRHCQAEGQAADALLTDEGRKQAQNLAEFLRGREVEHIVSSPFVRAISTIQPFAEHVGIAIETDVRLAERVLSSINLPDWKRCLSATFDDLDLVYEGGESSRDAMNRGVAVVKELLKSAYRNSVVVTHGNLLALILKYFDDRVGFGQWQELTNPDVFLLTRDED